jgi:hypothetical protein
VGRESFRHDIGQLLLDALVLSRRNNGIIIRKEMYSKLITVKQALDTLEDFRTEKYYPPTKLSTSLFDYILTESISTAELLQFLSLYRFYLEIHGSKVFNRLWKPSKTHRPFWKYLEVIWNRRDVAIQSHDLEQEQQYELLMEFMLDIVKKDTENGMLDGAFMYYCGVEDIHVWFPHLNDAFHTLKGRIDKRLFRYVPEWISLVLAIDQDWETWCARTHQIR